MSTDDGTSKYQRRVERFYSNSAPRQLFIRVLNSNTEIFHAKALLDVLQGIFPKSDVYLLLIITCQPHSHTCIVDGTQGRLLLHWIQLYSVDGIAYAEAVKAAYRHACSRCAQGEAPSTQAPVQALRPFEDVLQLTQPFFGGPPQLVPFQPHRVPLPVPCYTGLGVADAAFGAAGAVDPALPFAQLAPSSLSATLGCQVLPLLLPQRSQPQSQLQQQVLLQPMLLPQAPILLKLPQPRGACRALHAPQPPQPRCVAGALHRSAARSTLRIRQDQFLKQGQRPS